MSSTLLKEIYFYYKKLNVKEILIDGEGVFFIIEDNNGFNQLLDFKGILVVADNKTFKKYHEDGQMDKRILMKLDNNVYIYNRRMSLE